MLRIATAEQGVAEEERQREELDSVTKEIVSDSLAEEDEGFKLALTSRIERNWHENRSNKTKIEHTMLECVRERKGQYGPEERRLIEATGGSDIYMPVATAKTRAAIAHIKAIYLTAGHASHGITPTPNPELPEELEQQIVQRILSNPNMIDDSGQPISPADQVDMLASMARRKMEEASADAARHHEALINDQLTEGGYYKELSTYIEDICTFPVAFMKGPFYSVQPRLKWERTASMEMKPVSTLQTIAGFRAISPLDGYAAPGTDSVHKGAFLERLRMNRADLYRNRNQPGYNEQAVMDALADSDMGRLTDWLWTDSQMAHITDQQYFWYKSTTELDGLHWYDKARGTELLEWGMDPSLIEDPMEYYEVDAILVGRHVVRAAINPDPLYRRPIHSSCYEKIPGTIYGNSVPMLMRASGRAVNSTARALQNNLAFASGFQTEVNHERIAPETDIHEQDPYKIWQADESDVATNGAPAVRFFQPDDRSASLLGVIDYFKQAADVDTGIPEVLTGGGGSQSGADATARGRGMLLAESAKLLRSAIMNIDEDIVVPKIEILYTMNMLYHPDPKIKGDCQIEARGANAILQRESARQEHMAMLELTGNPMDAQIIGIGGRATMLKNVFGTFDDMKDKILPEGEEFDAMVAKLEQQQNQPPPPDPAVLKIQAEAEYNQQQLALEQQRFQFDVASNDPDREMQLKQLDLASKERIAQLQLDKDVQNEVTKFRAEKMAERAKAQIAVDQAKMEAEKEVRLRVAEMKAEQQNNREQRTHDAANQPPAPEVQQLSADEIKSIVETAVVPHIETVKSETLNVMNELIAKITAEQGNKEPAVFNIQVDSHSEPVEKEFTAHTDGDGAFSGSIKPVVPRRKR